MAKKNELKKGSWSKDDIRLLKKYLSRSLNHRGSGRSGA